MFSFGYLLVMTQNLLLFTGLDATLVCSLPEGSKLSDSCYFRVFPALCDFFREKISGFLYRGVLSSDPNLGTARYLFILRFICKLELEKERKRQRERDGPSN